MGFPTADKADICLLLEGTFPFVSGGVSSWVNQMIRGFPEYTFACCFIGSRPEDYGSMKYELPPNVVHLETHYLHNFKRGAEKRPMKGDASAYQQVGKFHELVKSGKNTEQKVAMFESMVGQLGDGKALSEDSFLRSRASWEYISRCYREQSRDPSFVDYFWTVRIMHSPIWALNKIADNLIPAKMYHTISTGYAGFLGALLKRRTGRPLLLSEHGIYTKERKIDLFQSEWISDNRGLVEKNNAEMAYFREKWVNFFSELGKQCYLAADEIVALYERNRERQVTDGAPGERTHNIPNGVDLPRFAAVREARGNDVPKVACLIGRVVPIKDVKTFLRSMRTVVNEIPDAQGWIAGPQDEDPEYVKECQGLVASLGLDKNVTFLGFQKIDELLPKVGVLVLSSISEALPLVILEGFAAGVPTVSTDVGSCRQLIEGLGAEDEALGKAGDVVGIADPEALGKAVTRLLTDRPAWDAAQQAGIRRVEALYTQELMFASYRNLYEGLMAKSAQGVAEIGKLKGHS